MVYVRLRSKMQNSVGLNLSRWICRAIIGYMLTFATLAFSQVSKVEGTVCYFKRNNQWYYQIMKEPRRLGSLCTIQNASYVPVYEGRVGTCLRSMDCTNTMNVHIQ